MINTQREILKRVPLKTLSMLNSEPKTSSTIDSEGNQVRYCIGDTYLAIQYKPSKLNIADILKEISIFGGVTGIKETTDGIELIDITGKKHRVKGHDKLSEKISFLEQSLIDRIDMLRLAENIYTYSAGEMNTVTELAYALSCISKYHGDYNPDNLYHIGVQHIFNLGRLTKVLVIKEVSQTGRRLHSRVGLHRHMDYHTFISVHALA